MTGTIFAGALACLALPVIFAGEIALLSLSPAPGMSRADLYYLPPPREARAVLVLCPGRNGNGRQYLEDARWVGFAERNRLGLVGLSFASEQTTRDIDSYYHAANGSGGLLVDGLKKIYGSDLPVLLYGTSGGAHFTARFTEWRPERVAAWCAYSAAWWDSPAPHPHLPPGIVACGKADERLMASLHYFWDGRELGKPWLWIGISGAGHVAVPELDAFVADYFEQILKKKNQSPNPEHDGIWVDIYEYSIIDRQAAAARPCASGWLPGRELYLKWINLNRRGGVKR